MKYVKTQSEIENNIYDYVQSTFMSISRWFGSMLSFILFDN